MTKPRVRRIYRTLTAEEKQRIKRVRGRIAKELPELIRRNQQARDAMKERTFSGSLRRAIRRSGFLLPDLARRAEVAVGDIADFLTGEKTLPSDAIDRLVKFLKLKLPTSKRRGAAKAS
jgi:hypothetical protein